MKPARNVEHAIFEYGASGRYLGNEVAVTAGEQRAQSYERNIEEGESAVRLHGDGSRRVGGLVQQADIQRGAWLGPRILKADYASEPGRRVQGDLDRSAAASDIDDLAHRSTRPSNAHHVTAWGHSGDGLIAPVVAGAYERLQCADSQGIQAY